MKLIKNILGTLLIAISTVLFSCDSFLDEVPDNRTQIDNAEKIAELLTKAYPEASYTTFIEPRTDNADDKGASARELRVNTEMYFWRDVDDPDSDFPTNYWNESYKAIAQANHALAAIEELGGGSDLNYLKGEALLARAYAHFMLVNIWGKTYNPATAASDLGIPYVTEPEDIVIKDYKRNSVKEVYDMIEADLTAGLPLVTNRYNVPKFHFTINAANAFASRFYTYKGDWQKVIEHSSIVLENNAASVLRDWGGDYQNLTYSETTVRYSAIEDPSNLLLVSGGSLFGRFFASARYQLSSDLRADLFDNNTNPIDNKGWAYRVFGNDLFLNIPKYDEYFRVTNAAANIGFAFTTYVLLSTDEVLLNRAEAYAMLGQDDNALQDMNTFLSIKTRQYDAGTDILSLDDIKSYYATDNGVYSPFYDIPEAQLPIIHGIAEFRRREFHNEGLRWFDIRRYNMEVIHRDFFDNEFVLTKEDNRKQLQIPADAIAFGLQPNPR
ncbi:RagB/SusD family nutrient uptake outer membrane protein [Aquimarina hainanensis]|uniref:RagB/SusD family nutrient uptake outer membrane protein n=1 Tax=Aquimarina hainanensis TaxID=1578017 RepID=A0ABW5N3C8_9FLAO|nr:RagB/SusD family nutrient uptake outer membrane protein [Aquimarina sp. TRL1]QKX04379.1 RagB/SusD family nutrient uptake outer membrane protein [Aquimarina sp. TRL1]